MHLLDRLNVYLFHYNRLKKWSGNFSKIQGWSSDQSQHARFKVIESATDFHQRSVLDLGCGYAELYDYLSKNHQLAAYTGVDQQHQFLKAAKKRLANESKVCHFVRRDISQFSMKNVDVVVASGSLNYQSRDPEYLTKIINRMYQMANETVIFNLLDSSTFPKQTLLAGYNKKGTLFYCKTLCPNVELIEDYANEDFTIVMRKQAK
ncbi:methyltransferase domain-containing protein [uncultured Vibrio sp.]|uniref:class I SAM-dependent methyltransferase n=1 Tax=uncultured Vibrio sp. TaxID=114054 RepID=UPI0025D03157|nr:methyltransferase domain-containing protein [uncultured Vibrio sp.]